MKRRVLRLGLLFILFYTCAFAEESITITTYYPSPYGSYNDLYVANNVGIGTATPVYGLDTRRNTAINGASFYVRSDPTVLWDFLKFSVDGAIGRFDVKQVDFRMGMNNTTDAGETFTDVFSIIQPNGNVGIGTNNPGSDRLDVRGRAYAEGGWQTTDADYAEWFEKEENIKPTDVIGINLATGKARKYRIGDKFIGIASSNPGIVGNRMKETEEEMAKTHILVALLGQVDFDVTQVKIKNRIVKTKDGKEIGVLLSDGKIFIRTGDGS